MEPCIHIGFLTGKVPNAFMPRKSRIEELGIGRRVLDLHYTDGMSVTDISRLLMSEGTFVTTEQISHYLTTRPGELVEAAKEKGLADKLEPIFNYADRLQSLFEDIHAVQQKAMTELGHVLAMPEEEAHQKLLEITVYANLTEVQQKNLISAVKRLYVAPVYLRMLESMTGEARKLIALGAKIDQSAKATAPKGNEYHIHGDVNVLTPESIMQAVEDAKKAHHAVIDVKGGVKKDEKANG